MFNRSFVAGPPLCMCDSDVALSVSRRGGEKGGAAAGDYIAASRGAFAPLFSSVFRRAVTAKCFRSREDMAGYLKVLSSLSRSAGAAFSRNPAVLAPAANCQTLQQRNCKWRDSRFIPSIIMLTVNCSLT